MKGISGACVLLALALASACSPEPEADSTGFWVGTITPEGDVTTVVNESGSVWGGTAMLVEEASIGVESGADEYMLGEVFGIAATPDNIFVIDRQIPAVRVYDAHGVYQRDVGGPGQGPGEFQRPASIAIGTNGQIFLRDDAGRRILVYSQDGDYLHAYPMTGGMNTSRPMALSRDDVPYTTVFVGLRTDDPYRVFDIAMQAHGSDGPYGDLIMQPVADSFVPSVISSDDGSVQRPVPFSPREVWAVTADLDVIFGVSRSYRFEVRRRDGSLLEVERSAALVAVDPDEAAWHRANATAIMRDIIPDWIWNGPEVADTNRHFASSFPQGPARFGYDARVPAPRCPVATKPPSPALSSPATLVGRSKTWWTYSATTAAISAPSTPRRRCSSRRARQLTATTWSLVPKTKPARSW